MISAISIDPREFVTKVYRAGVAAADPRRATRQAVEALPDLASRVGVIAVGKGAHGMASGAVEALRARGVSVAAGLVVANEADPSTTHGLESLEGDHPTPAGRSFAAAERLATVAARSTPESDAIVLVSGGATSLIAAPIPGITETQLQETFAALLASGADIGLMNAIRKRLLRFAAGRLALALGSRRVHCLIASDVIGNDTSAIASGPCVPDPISSRDARERAIAAGVWHPLPDRVRHVLEAMASGRAPDVPPRGHPRFSSTSSHVILDRTDAERGAAEAARQLGVAVTVNATPLSGDAATAGRQFADDLRRRERTGNECFIWSGEATVALGSGSGRGGRCQEFALACAAALEAAGVDARSITVLAAGTDGRDGPTDAAGAIIDATTCHEMRQRGLDPVHSLHHHDSYSALDSVGALLRTGPTGTNVNDLVIGLIH